MLKKCISPKFVWIFVMENDGHGGGKVSLITLTLKKKTITSSLKSHDIHLNLIRPTIPIEPYTPRGQNLKTLP